MFNSLAINKLTSVVETVALQRAITGPLYCISVLYFLLPNLIFVIGFTGWYVALFIVGSLLAGAYFDIRYELNLTPDWRLRTRHVAYFLLICCLAGVWTALFGAGFQGPQTGDQLKNHMIFRDLFMLSWPVIYSDMPDTMRFLSYPLGYYLVPALAGKLFGWSIGVICIYLWTTLGIGLLWSWFFVLFSRFAWFAIIIFVLFSGLDIIGVALQGQPVPQAGTHLEWWAGWTFLQYSSNATVMSWSTQHGAAQWLFPMLFFYRLVCCKSSRGSALLVCLASFWSHLTLLGIIVFLPLYFRRGRFLQALKDPAMLAFPFFIMVACFYASKAPGAIDAGFIWNLWPMAKALPLLLWFYLLEFGLLALFIFAVKRFVDRDEMLLFIAAIVLLTAIPMYHIGWSNDVSMRVSAIPLFVLFIFFCLALKQSFLEKNKSALAVGFIYIFIAAFTPMNEMFRQWSGIASQRFFSADITDVNWDRGVSRAEPNCLITKVPRSFILQVGDQVSILGNGRFDITKVQIDDKVQRLCITNRYAIKQRPQGLLSLDFYRDNTYLHDKYYWRSGLAPETITSVVSVWPQQYTGSTASFFYKYVLAN